MKKILSTLCLSTLALTGIAQTRTARFTDFRYEGRDALPTINKESQYLNPIISGCAPDPSITRKGDDYFLANSSFSYYPGVPIWHSRDLVNWDFAGYALTTDLKLGDGVGLSAGVYAPDIKYNPYNDTFYLVVTAIGSGGNVVVKTKDPYQGWGRAIPIDVPGIDPGFLFEPDGKAYIVNNQDPDGPAEYDGHRAIGLREYDLKTDRIVPGSAIQLIEKGVHPEDKPIWCEGPHLYHIGGTYYLMTAEGGTADNHSEVIYRSDHVKGPYTPCEINPILTQRDLSKDRKNPITAAGHADLFQTPTGEWWSIFLGILPYEYGNNTYCNTGRSTFLLPAEWIVTGKTADGKLLRQPILYPAGKEIPYVVDKTNIEAQGQRDQNTGNVLITDFQTTPVKTKTASTLSPSPIDPLWIQVRTPQAAWYRKSNDGALEIDLRPVSIYSQSNPSYLCRWVKNHRYDVQVTLSKTFQAQSPKDYAGLVIYQDEKNNFTIGRTRSAEGKPVIQLNVTDRGAHSQTIALEDKWKNKDIQFRIAADGTDLRFFFSTDNGKSWTQMGETFNGRILSTEWAGGFTGATVGMYATSQHQ